jgi:hypothetical protein
MSHDDKFRTAIDHEDHLTFVIITIPLTITLLTGVIVTSA